MRSCCEHGSSWNALIISCSCFCRNAYEYSWKCCKNAAAGHQGMITSLKSYTICIFLTDRHVYEAHHAYQERCSCMRMLVTPGVLMASQRCCKESIYTLVLIIANVLGLRCKDWRREAETSLCCSCWGFSAWVLYPWLLASKYWLPLDWEEKKNGTSAESSMCYHGIRAQFETYSVIVVWARGDIISSQPQRLWNVTPPPLNSPFQ